VVEKGDGKDAGGAINGGEDKEESYQVPKNVVGRTPREAIGRRST